MDLSIVIPCYRSSKNIRPVVENIESVFGKEGITFEIILVNDCSPDNTFEVISSIANKKNNVTAIDLAKNSGQHAALMAGFKYATGDLVATCEDDGQTNIEIFPEMIRKIKEEGYDVVSPKYKSRIQPSLFRRTGTKIARAMSSWLIEKPSNINVGVIFVAKHFVINEIIKYDQPFPYLSGLICRITHNICNVESVQKARETGKSGYNFKRLLELWLNGFTAFSIKPLRLSVFTGVASAIVGFIFGIFIVLRKIFGWSLLPGWTSMIAIMLVMFGLVLAVLGMIGEYIGRIYLCINGTPQYVVRTVCGKRKDSCEKENV